jgi:hypothetical protein
MVRGGRSARADCSEEFRATLEEDARDVDGDVSIADDDGGRAREVDGVLLVVGVAVVPNRDSCARMQSGFAEAARWAGMAESVDTS